MLNQQDNPQNAVFNMLDRVPSQLWYILGVASIVSSAILQIAGKKNWADFVGKWPPTFFAVGLYHKLVRPGQEDASGRLRQVVDQAQNNAREVGA